MIANQTFGPPAENERPSKSGADIRVPCSDLFNRPSIIKSGPNLPLRDPPGALRAGLLVAET